MVTVTRDTSYGPGDRFKIKLSPGIPGWRSVTYKRATLAEAQLALAHYYDGGAHLETRSTDSACIVCRTLAKTDAKEGEHHARSMA